MTQPDSNAPDSRPPGSTDSPPNEEPPATQQPRWEGDFNPERAARLVQNLRDDLTKAKNEAKAASDALQVKSDAEKSELQRATDRAEKSERALLAAQLEVLRTTIARKHNLPDELVQFVTGNTEAELEKQAAALASYANKGLPDSAGELGKTKPRPRLVPGHSTDDRNNGPFDARAVAAQIRNL